MRREAAAPPSISPSPSIGTDPKQTVAESNVPSAQAGFSVKESVATLCCVEGRTNGGEGQQEREGEGVTGKKGRKGYLIWVC